MELIVVGRDLFLEILRQNCAFEAGTYFRSDACTGHKIIRCHLLDFTPDRYSRINGSQKLFKGRRGHDATLRHADPSTGQFTEARSFAANAQPVVDANLVEPAYEFRIRQRRPLSIQDPDNPAIAIYAKPLPSLDALRRLTGAHHRGQPILPRYDGRV